MSLLTHPLHQPPIQDGTMSLEMKLTGILSTSYRPLDQAPGE
jgi:hypothetical protein